jgi:hypothetical protein
MIRFKEFWRGRLGILAFNVLQSKFLHCILNELKPNSNTRYAFRDCPMRLLFIPLYSCHANHNKNLPVFLSKFLNTVLSRNLWPAVKCETSLFMARHKITKITFSDENYIQWRKNWKRPFSLFVPCRKVRKRRFSC